MTVMHFQERLQQPICQSGRLSNTTFDRSEVTCKNCIQKLKYQVRGPVDWDGLYNALSKQIVEVNLSLKEFLFAHPSIAGAAWLENLPPQISLIFWFPVRGKSRRKIVSYNTSPTDEPNYVDVYVPTEDEMNEVATFVGTLGMALSLKPRRNPERRTEVPLAYQLRPNYTATARN